MSRHLAVAILRMPAVWLYEAYTPGLHPPACAAGVRAHARCQCGRDRVSCRRGCARGPRCAHGGAFRACERSAGRSVLRHRGVAAVCLGLCGRLPKRRRLYQAAACGLLWAGLRRAMPLPLSAPARGVRLAQHGRCARPIRAGRARGARSRAQPLHVLALAG